MIERKIFNERKRKGKEGNRLVVLAYLDSRGWDKGVCLFFENMVFGSSPKGINWLYQWRCWGTEKLNECSRAETGEKTAIEGDTLDRQ